MPSRGIAALCIVIALALASSNNAQARMVYDGAWIVQMSGQTQACMGTVRYSLYIQNGRIGYAGGDASVSGRVSGNGAVSVRIATSGGQRGFGTGRLSRGYGLGTFRGYSSSGPCNGTWAGQRIR
jgi:hypothetical protein